MKNFTNNFKQFTSRLSARWLIMALMMLAGTSSAWAAIYLKGSFNGWGTSNTFDGNGNCTITLSKGDYTFKIDDGGTWYGNGESIARSNCLDVSIGGPKGSDMKLNVDVTGSYKFYWNGDDKKLTVTYPQACTKCCDNVVIKHPWGGGGWTYKTAEECDGTVYSLEAKYGNNGCNWKLNDGSENWISQQDSKFILVGNPSIGDDCTFSFNTSNKTITITKVVQCDNNPDFSVSLSKSEVAVGCTGVTASITGNDSPTVTWSSSNISVATINSSTGAITIKAAGTTTITATTTEADGFCGGVEKTATLTVKSPSVKVDANYNSLCEGEVLTLIANLTNCGTGNSIQWYKEANPIAGETRATLTINSVATANSGNYKAVVSGGILCSSVESTPITITVNARPAAPTFDKIDAQCGSYPLPTEDKNKVSVNWYNANGNKITTVTQSGTYYAEAVNANNCTSTQRTAVEIIIDKTPTISGETFTQPGGQNKIELTVPDGITAKWSVSPEADLSVSEGNSTMFSAETNGTYTITATNGTCSDTHVVTVADAFYVYFRAPKEGEETTQSKDAWYQFYYPNENSEQYRGGAMYYGESDAMPTSATLQNFNKGGKTAEIIFTDCDDYTWYGFKASAEVIAGTKYFYVHATNDKGLNGCHTHTKPQKLALTGDIYYTLGDNGSCYDGWAVNKVLAPYAGPKVHASGDAKFNANNFADFVSLYVTDCSGNEVTGYQWSYTAPTCTYIGKKTVTMSASTSNNIRVREAGSYTCTVTYKDGTTVTSPALTVSTGATNTPTLAEFSSNLPIIMVNTNGVGFPDCTGLSGQTASKNASTLKEKRSVDVIIKDGNNIIYDRKARMNYRGSSSLNFVKKSYAFCPGEADCVEDKGRQDYVKTAKLNMLGLGKAYDKDWVLYAAAADPSLMRNRLVFDSYTAMTGEWGVQSRYVELIVDGVYKGVYVFMDKITMNKKRVKVDEKTGFIVKFDKTDKEDRIGGYNGVYGDEKTFATDLTGRKDISTYDTSVDQLFEIEYPEKDDYPTGWGNRTTAIKNMFNNFENALKDGDFTTVQQYIDYTSWADWFIINEYTKNVDAYRASCIFVYTGEAGAKIEARPLWDQELSFNNTATTVGNGKGCNSTADLLINNDGVYTDGFPAPFWFTGNYSTSNGQFTKDKYKGLLDDPCFVQVVKERWETHKAGALSEASLQELITEYYNDLADYDESTKTYAQTSAKTREEAFWTNKSRGACDCSYDTGNTTATGYSNVTMDASKGTMDTWVLDAQRRAGLSTALSGLTGTTMNIQIIPTTIEVTPWEAATITINKSEGYDYTLENDLEAVSGVVVQKNGQSITYRIPRPSDWGTGDGNDSREDITYTITATLNVADGTMVCGTTTAPSSTATIILQDEKDENCPQ